MEQQRINKTDDVQTLSALGYEQELSRHMGGYSSLAVSLTITSALASGITALHLGLSAVGGGAIGIGWPLSCIFSLILAATMGQLASAYPTAGGAYHWATILGGRGWGWTTGWFSLIGLVALVASVNVGILSFGRQFLANLTASGFGGTSSALLVILEIGIVAVIVASQAVINHRGIRLTARLIDLGGYLIIGCSATIAIVFLAIAPTLDWTRLFTLTNYSGLLGGNVWSQTDRILPLFCFGLLLPAYAIAGFDAPVHTSEETIAAQHTVPRNIVYSVLISGCLGWLLLAAIVLALPSVDIAAAQGQNIFFWLIRTTLPDSLAIGFVVSILAAQYFCGLALLTAASRLLYAFARDHGLPQSESLRRICPRFLTPRNAIWTVAVLAIIISAVVPLYSVLSSVCVIFLYLSYLIPVALGFYAYGRTWHQFGSWTLGRWFKPACVVSIVGGGGVIWLAIQPPNNQAAVILMITGGMIALGWFSLGRHHFLGPKMPTFADLESFQASPRHLTSSVKHIVIYSVIALTLAAGGISWWRSKKIPPSAPSATESYTLLDPCDVIAEACMKAGFINGHENVGRGLFANCIRPLMERTETSQGSLPLPAIDPIMLHACKSFPREFDLSSYVSP